MMPEVPGGSEGLALLVGEHLRPDLTAFVVYPPLRGVQGRLSPRVLPYASSYAG